MKLRQYYRETNMAERTSFVWMWIGGMTARAIAKKMGIHSSTVSRWINRWRREGSVTTRSRTGRPCKVIYTRAAGVDVLSVPVVVWDPQWRTLQEDCGLFGVSPVSPYTPASPVVVDGISKDDPGWSRPKEGRQIHVKETQPFLSEVTWDGESLSKRLYRGTRVDGVRENELLSDNDKSCLGCNAGYGNNTSSSLMLMMDGTAWTASVFKGLAQLDAPYGVEIYEVTSGGDGNFTHSQLSHAVAQARWLRDVLWCVTVVIVSDDPVFLTAFAESSFKSHLLLVQTTKLLAFTRLPLHHLHTLHHIHKTVSRTNSLTIIVNDHPRAFRANVYSMVPVSQPDSLPTRVASWTPGRGLVLPSSCHLFPDKFSKFPERPHLVVTAEQLAGNVAVMVDDPTAPGGQRLTFRGYMDNTIRFIAKQMNFMFTYERPADRTWGNRQNDGSWSGMAGLLMRGEAEIGLGPFAMTQIRFKYMQFSQYITHIEHKVTAILGRPEVDPWGFLLPLSPLVWAAVVTALLAVITFMLILPSCLPPEVKKKMKNNSFCFVRVLLQQDMGSVAVGGSRWWWERVVVGVWMLSTLVMTKSYAGNLMSLLAVRHIDQSYQSLRNVLDDSSVVLILTAGNSNLAYYRTAKSGIFREVGDLLGTDRVTYRTVDELPTALDTLVRSGTHVMFDVETTIRNMMADDFVSTGTCEFYMGRSSHLAYTMGIVAQKNSPLIPGINKGVAWLVESGLFVKWMNFAKLLPKSCVNPPRIITVTSVLSLANLWGMFVVLGIGFVIGVMVLVAEITVAGMYNYSN